MVNSLSLPRDSTNYVISGTKFFRLSSRAIFQTYGGNLQNKEKSMRQMYIADEGKALIQVDQSGAEALIVAYLCKPGNFRKLFECVIKPHCFVGLHLFKEVWQSEIDKQGLDIKCNIEELCQTLIEDLKKNPWWKDIDKLIKSSDNWPPQRRFYYIAKQVCHSSNYGIKAGMFCLNTLEKSKGKVVLRKDQAETFLTMYHELFPEIRDWHSRVEQQVKSTRILYNLLGNPITFTGDLETESALKECYSCIPQSTVAMITRTALSGLQEFIENNSKDWDILADTHDSILCQAPIHEANDCCIIMKQFIEQKLKSSYDGAEFYMRSEGAIGNNWAPFHPVNNPEGLKSID